MNVSLTTNFYSNNKRIGGPKTVTVGRSSLISRPPLGIATAASNQKLLTLMVIHMRHRPRRGDDEEVRYHRRSRSLLAGGGFVVGLA